jgi:broad specificity phosphatase PhoE
MTIRLHLLATPATAQTRKLAFATPDEPLGDIGRRALGRMAALPSTDVLLRSPARVAADMAEELRLSAAVEPLLSDCDFGRWAGLTLAQLNEAEPKASSQWLSDPRKAPHDGESFAAVIARVAGWMASLAAVNEGRTTAVLAITHPLVIRAAVITAIGADASSFHQIDVAPLARVQLSYAVQRWTLVALVPPKTEP